LCRPRTQLKLAALSQLIKALLLYSNCPVFGAHGGIAGERLLEGFDHAIAFREFQFIRLAHLSDLNRMRSVEFIDLI
jgi:hypothetical protein